MSAYLENQRPEDYYWNDYGYGQYNYNCNYGGYYKPEGYTQQPESLLQRALMYGQKAAPIKKEDVNDCSSTSQEDFFQYYGGQDAPHQEFKQCQAEQPKPVFHQPPVENNNNSSHGMTMDGPGQMAKMADQGQPDETIYPWMKSSFRSGIIKSHT